MNQHNFRNEQRLIALVFEYEAMSQKGTVGFLEETAFFELLRHYEKTQKPLEAINVTNYAISQHPFCLDFHLKKAELLIELQRPAEALLALEEAQKYAPSDLEVNLFIVEALTELKETSKAFSILENLRIHASKEDLSYIYFSEALIHESCNEFRGMYESLRKAVLANPNHEEAMERLWLCVEMCQNYQESVQLHTQVIDENPYSHIAWFNLGHAYYCLGQFHKSAEAFEYAYIIDEAFEFAYRDCAEACIMAGDLKAALKHLEEGLEHIRPDSNILARIGFCHEGLGHTNLAKNYYLESLEYDAYNDQAYFRMGEVYVREREWEQAIGYYRKAIIVDETKEEYHAALAVAYHQIDHEDKALLFYQRAVDTAPEISKYWILYATFLLDIGKNEKALDILEEAIVYAGGPELLYGKIACMILLNRKEEALYLLQEALNHSFDRHESLFQIVPSLEGDPDIMTMIAAHQAQ